MLAHRVDPGRAFLILAGEGLGVDRAEALPLFDHGLRFPAVAFRETFGLLVLQSSGFFRAVPARFLGALFLLAGFTLPSKFGGTLE